MELLSQIKDDQFTDELKATLKRQIELSSVDLTLNPRDETEGNLKLLNAVMLIALGSAQDLYGSGEDTGLDPFPRFEDQPQSQIVPLMGDHGTVAIVLGTYVKSWEEVFYDICHESLHLLNPVIKVNDREVRVSALEEGVAVKFAEKMYEKCIKPYCGQTPLTSPVNSPSSQYYLAFNAAKKIPDDVLKEIRSVFGKFSNIEDSGKFKRLVNQYLNDEEIRILVEVFVYK